MRAICQACSAQGRAVVLFRPVKSANNLLNVCIAKRNSYKVTHFSSVYIFRRTSQVHSMAWPVCPLHSHHDV